MGWVGKMGLRPEVCHFFECVRTRQTPTTSGPEAVRTQALMDRLLLAMGLPLAGREA